MNIYLLELKYLKEYESFINLNSNLIKKPFLENQQNFISRLMYLTCAYVLRNHYDVMAPIQLIKDINEKPVLNQDNIHLSFSHSSNHIAFGISTKKHGIDIEKIRMLPKPLLKYYNNNFKYSSVEKNNFISHMKYWTSLEALAKLVQICVFDLIQEAKLDTGGVQYRDQIYRSHNFIISESSIISIIDTDTKKTQLNFFSIQPSLQNNELRILSFDATNT